MTEIDHFLISLPEDTKSFLVDQIKRGGPNPMGESLANSQPIYKLTYGHNYANMFYVGQPRELGKDRVKVTIHAILYDWINSKDIPTYAIMAQKKDGHVVLFETVSSHEKRVTYEIGKE